MTLADQVRAELDTVLDPCSIYNGTRLSFVELGMVERISTPAPGQVTVRMLLDDPVCLYVSRIHDEVRAAALRVPGVDSVEIEFSGDEIWTDDRAAPAVRERIRERREQLRRRAVAINQTRRRPQ